MTIEEKIENKTPTEGIAQRPPCVLMNQKTGEHSKYNLHSEHRKGYKFWIPICPYCGWIDTDKISQDVVTQEKSEAVREFKSEILRQKSRLTMKWDSGKQQSWAYDKMLEYLAQQAKEDKQ